MVGRARSTSVANSGEPIGRQYTTVKMVIIIPFPPYSFVSIPLSCFLSERGRHPVGAKIKQILLPGRRSAVSHGGKSDAGETGDRL